MISPEIRAQIRRYFFAEHWKIGTIVQEMVVHPDTVRNAIEAQRLGGAQPVRPSMVDPYLEFIRQILDQHPRLRATRIYQMAQDRGRGALWAGQRGPVAAHRGPLAAPDPRAVSASGNFSR